MMKSLCQFIAAIFLINLSGCGWLSRSDHDVSELLTRVESSWYSIDPKIKIAKWGGDVQPHLFYDPQAGFSAKNPVVNYIPLVVPNDERAFGIDVLSGQRFFSHLNCAQNDVWKERSSISALPQYVRGFVPRTFDQINEPLQVIVLGTKNVSLQTQRFYQARIVSSYVEQICPFGKCTLPSDWLNRIVLVAVDLERQDLVGVTDLEKLQELINWKDVRAQLENHFGRNKSSEEEFPAIRVGQLLPLQEGMNYLINRSIKLTNVELVKLYRSCLNLYDKLWDNVGQKTLLDKKARSSQEIKEFQRIVETLRKQNKPVFFNERLGSFLKEFGSEMATCSRLVYPGNFNAAPDRFHFISWIGLLTRLHKEGWEFDCRRGHWNMENIGSRAIKNLQRFNCTNKHIDQAIEEIPFLLKTARASKGEHWRYVGWDEQAHGSHAKIFGWVKVPDRHFACANDLNAKIRGEWKQKAEGLSWKKRHSVKNLNEADYIY